MSKDDTGNTSYEGRIQ